MSEIVTIVISSLSTCGIGGFFGWLFGRRQNKANANSTEITNFSEAIDAYKKMYEDMEAARNKQIEELKQENKDLKDELSETRKQVMTLTNFVLASAIKRADGNLEINDINNLREIIK